MKVTLEFVKYSERYPDKDRPILSVFPNPGGEDMVVHGSYNGLYKKGFEEYLWWCYFDFQPERSKREEAQECAMRCSEQCRNALRDK